MVEIRYIGEELIDKLLNKKGDVTIYYVDSEDNRYKTEFFTKHLKTKCKLTSTKVERFFFPLTEEIEILSNGNKIHFVYNKELGEWF